MTMRVMSQEKEKKWSLQTSKTIVEVSTGVKNRSDIICKEEK